MEKKDKHKATMHVNEETEVDDNNERKLKKLRTQLKVELINPNPQKISPLIGYFPTGYNPIKKSPTTHDDDEDEEEEGREVKVRVLKNVKRTNRLQLVVSPNKSKVEFVGTNYSGEATTPQMCTYALGIVDKQTGTLKIVQIEANRIFRLEPKFDESHLTENAVSDSLKKEHDAELLLAYSTRKDIRRDNERKGLLGPQDPELLEALEKKIGGIEINKKALEVAETTTSNNGRNIPPHDLSTDNVAMVYPVNKIIFSGEWDYLNDIVELLKAGKELQQDSYPLFVRNRVHILDEMKDEDAKLNLSGIFSYITHLIKFKDKNSMDGFKSAKNHKLPSILSQKFNTMFADSDSRRLADDKRDLLISYVLVLTLITDKFKTDLSDIAKDLRLKPIELRKRFQSLGCKLSIEKHATFAVLKAPLEFPKIRFKRKR